MRGHFRPRKLLFIIPIVILVFLGFSAVVMLLWNNVLAAVVSVKLLSYPQAMGILVLSKILFGGFKGRGGFGGPGAMWRYKMHEKWESMTPEEREKFKAEWKNRCVGRRWGRMDESNESQAMSS